MCSSRPDYYVHLNNSNPLGSCFHQCNVNCSWTPFQITVGKEPTPTDGLIDARPYQRAVRALRYMVDSTRINLAVIASAFARVLHQQTKRHWPAAQKMARYILQSTHTGLQYSLETGVCKRKLTLRLQWPCPAAVSVWLCDVTWINSYYMNFAHY